MYHSANTVKNGSRANNFKIPFPNPQLIAKTIKNTNFHRFKFSNSLLLTFVLSVVMVMIVINDFC